MNTRRFVYATLLTSAVLGPIVLVGLSFVRRAHPPLLAWALFGGIGAITLLCVWCAVYVRDEPRLTRIALIWVALLFLLLTIAIAWTAPTDIGGDTKGQRVMADIRMLDSQLERYKTLNGAYPTTEQGLRAFGVEGKDAWSNDYVYRCPGKRYPDRYDLFSAGPDRIADTADDDWGK